MICFLNEFTSTLDADSTRVSTICLPMVPLTTLPSSMDNIMMTISFWRLSSSLSSSTWLECFDSLSCMLAKRNRNPPTASHNLKTTTQAIHQLRFFQGFFQGFFEGFCQDEYRVSTKLYTIFDQVTTNFCLIFDQFLNNYWPIFDQTGINFWPIFDQITTKLQPNFDQFQSNFWPISVQFLANFWLIIDQFLPIFWTIFDQITTKLWPFFGQSENQDTGDPSAGIL